jgi:hypothetical protein
MDSKCVVCPSDKEQVLFSGNTNFSVVSRTINGKKHTIIKHSGEFDMENNTISELLDCVNSILVKQRRS